MKGGIFVLKHNGKAVASLVLGIISLLVWLVPLFGYPVSIVGLVMGVYGVQSWKKNIGMAGLILSIIGLVLCIANSAIGAYLGATGQMF